MMSLIPDSPVNSSSSSDGFCALDDALATISSDDDDEQELLSNNTDDNNQEEELYLDNIIDHNHDDEDNNNDDDFRVQSVKRRKVVVVGSEDKEDRNGTTSFVAVTEEEATTSTKQKSEASSENEQCCLEGRHPGFFGDMCVRCGVIVNDASAVPVGYIHKNLKIVSDEMDRLRGSDLKSLLRNRKLYLVLDLDHTLLNSTRLFDLSPEEDYLNNQIDSLQDIPKGSLFKLERMHMMTKLRPFVRMFLREASSMYEMYIYTMGEKAYALQMADLLDPARVYFDCKVVSQADCTEKHQKGLDVVLGADSAVVILDDTEFVWSKHRENLILMERYHFFASSGRQFGFRFKSLSESKIDESEAEGALANILNVLKRVHQMFFDLEHDADGMSRDVRQVLKTVRQEVLKGCRLVFSRVWKTGEIAHNQKLWEMAVQLGATCSTNLDSSVTHVVSTDTGTDKAKWAAQHKKFLVHPRWIEAANYFWKRQSEEKFAVNPIQKK